jgi:PKD repeat protein
MTAKRGRGQAACVDNTKMTMMRVFLVALLVVSVLAGMVGCKEITPPEVGFTAAPLTGQAPLEVTFSEQSRGEVTSWEWDFDGDGLVDSIDRDPTYIYTDPGTYPVTLRVNGPGGSDIETKLAYMEVAVPTSSIAGVSPNSGNRGDTMDAVITGTNLAGAGAVSLGDGITVNTFNVESPTQVTASITIGNTTVPGSRSVSVTTPIGSAHLPGGFTVLRPPEPVLTGISPTTGDQGERLQLVIGGYNFTQDSLPSLGEGISITGLAVDSATTMRGNIMIAGNATAGSRDVLVTSPGGTGVLPDGFNVTVPPRPIVAAVEPATGVRGESLAVVITGSHLDGTSSLAFRSGLGITVNSFAVESRTRIIGNITIGATAATGPSDVSVTTPGGSGTLVRGFTVTVIPAPTITVVIPFARGRAETANATIIGTNLTGATAVSFGPGIEVSKLNVDSPTRVSASIRVAADAKEGVRDVSVTTPGGTYNQYRAFTVVPYAPCKADFWATPLSGEVDTTVKFYCQLSGSITSGSWDFDGDGIFDSYSCNPSYKYTKAGLYDVTLRVYGPDFCESVITKENYIEIKPEAEEEEATPTPWCK